MDLDERATGHIFWEAEYFRQADQSHLKRKRCKTGPAKV